MKNSDNTKDIYFFYSPILFLFFLLLSSPLRPYVPPEKMPLSSIQSAPGGHTLNTVWPDKANYTVVRMEVTAYYPIEKNLDKYTVSLYNTENDIFERISNEQKVQELWQSVDWATGKVVFSTMPVSLVGKNKHSTLQVFLCAMREKILQEQAGKCAWTDTQILLSFMCEHSFKQTEDQRKNPPQNTRVYFYLETGSPKIALWESAGTYLGGGKKGKEVVTAKRDCTPYQLYRRRQQAREPNSLSKQRTTSKDSRKNTLFNQRVYSTQKTTKSTDRVYFKAIVTGYCICEKCCGIWATKGINDEGVRLTANNSPAEGFLIAAPRQIPFNTLMRVPGYAGGLLVPVKDRGGDHCDAMLHAYRIKTHTKKSEAFILVDDEGFTSFTDNNFFELGFVNGALEYLTRAQATSVTIRKRRKREGNLMHSTEILETAVG